MTLDSEPVGQNQTPHAERKTDAETRHSGPEMASATSSSGTPPAEAHHKSTFHPEKDRWSRFKPVVELVGLVLLGVYTAYTIKMYSANKNAADAAQSAAKTAADALLDERTHFVVEQRPILWLTNQLGTPQIDINQKNPSLSQMVWTWHFTNYGKTPPQNVRWKSYFKIGDNSPVLSYGEPESGSFGGPTPPGKDDFASTVSAPMKVSDSKNFILSGNVTLMVVMNYSDLSGNAYETGICLNRLNLGAIAYCREGNYIK